MTVRTASCTQSIRALEFRNWHHLRSAVIMYSVDIVCRGSLILSAVETKFRGVELPTMVTHMFHYHEIHLDLQFVPRSKHSLPRL